MTFVPFDNPTDFFGDLIDESQGAPGLDGSTLPLWYASIGPKGEPGKQAIGVPVPPKEAIGINEGVDTISAYRRELFAANLTVEDYEGKEHPDSLERAVVEDLREANVYSSALIDENGERTGFHTIAIDVDHPVRLRETDTPGHYHLLIDVPMPWEVYEKVLDSLTEAGVVEEGYYEASVEREATCLRLPWVHKVKPEDEGLLVDPDGFGPLPIFDAEELPPPVRPVDKAWHAEPQLTGPHASVLTGLECRGEVQFPKGDPAEIVWDQSEYDVEFVGGKGVLRRRKA